MVLLISETLPAPTHTPPVPPLTVVRRNVRSPASPTAKIRNLGAVLARLIVLLLPAMMMSLRMTGSPVGPKTVLLTVISLWVLPLGNTILSAPLPLVQRPFAVVLLLAALMAL